MFRNFNDISLENKNTWEKKRILTFDIDWASDEVLKYTLDLLEENSVKATFFVTHATDILTRIRANKDFELAIHPNFNQILNKQSNKSVNRIFSEIIEIVPEAKISRSHSLTNSGSWNGLYKKNKIIYTSNYLMYLCDYIQPIRNINGIVEIPIFFADDALLYLNNNQNNLQHSSFLNIDFKGIQVFLFHPIHIALNSYSLDFYNETRKFHKNWKKDSYLSHQKKGIKDLLEDLINFRN